MQTRALGQVHVFPDPRQIEVLETSFRLDGQELVVLPLKASENDAFLARFLVAESADRYGLALKTEPSAKLPTGRRLILMGSITNPLVKEYCLRHRIDVTDRQPGPEGYLLQVSKDTVLIAGSDERGAFYGLQSLRQLMEKEPSGVRIRGVRIRDWPYKPFL